MSDEESATLAQERESLPLHVDMCERRSRRTDRNIERVRQEMAHRLDRQDNQLRRILRLHVALLGILVTYFAPHLLPILQHVAPLARALTLP